MNNSRWNRSRVKPKSHEVTSKIGDLVVYHWSQFVERIDDELCLVVAVDGEVMTIQPINGECAFPAGQHEVSPVE